MKRSGLSVCLLAAVTITATGTVQAQELKTMDDVGGALNACWSPPSDSKNSAVTLSFSFKRDGSLIGPPRASAINVQGDDKAKKAFVDAAIEAVEKCAPLKLAPSLAQGIGGNVFTMQFHSSD
ncbi:hypothetical protein [Brucella anthropi]|uniref:hypothetical protein n=1 Tax=Brucella anthropi TaxID=529 RepID=UPI0004A74570|nr:MULTISPECIES: hypothetical protein [Brucella/Ochrobactrum group]MCR5940854.1 hypothetical protein [Ochrobactrum sp. XJ1]KAB2740829.1 hypothetical protein F9K89_05645 [Brucella anthropi]KAB2770420.1 hypothetical protein F9K84_06695 [Brucella anthropi]KAB2794269.1 hypothetical protein F9K96_03645 [Brucella anthropi]HBQ32956.1 hypothetical protein [Brucella anthropi]